MLKLDNWQKKILSATGNVVLRSGRQVGKSTVIAQKAGEYAVKHRNKTILVIAAVERQAFLIFDKIYNYINDNYKDMIGSDRFRPVTASRIHLKNGSTIHSLPVGMYGHNIRGYTVDLLIADEAAFIPEEVWAAVTPMLATTKGNIVLLSTPFGRGGYFYQCFEDPNFSNFHISSEDCPRINKEFLEQEKRRMTKLQYAQEYLGEFVDELRMLFSEELIRSCMTLKRKDPLPREGKNYLGVDVARMGKDDTVLFPVREHKNTIYQIGLETTNKTRLTETVKMILNADSRHNYKKIYIDTGGLGVGVYDPLLEHKQTRRKVVSIDNARRSLDRDKEKGQKTTLLKEDLYNNLLVMMEQGRVKLYEDPDVALSLKSIQAEYTDAGKMKIFGNYSHITEALIRAAWCLKTKSLNIYIH